MNSEGSNIFQHIIGCGPLMMASGNSSDGRAESGLLKRSYPHSLSPGFATSGFEWIEKKDLTKNARYLARELRELQHGKACPAGKMDLIIDGELLALQIHETIGHPTEIDRALETEWDFAGSTFLTPEKLGKIRYGPDFINAVADATIEGGPDTFAFDDEAVSAKRVNLIEGGVFVGYQSSRERAAELGLSKSSGAMRSVTGLHLPLIRMTNINLLPGDNNREEMIRETKHGLFLSGPTMEIFDQRRRTFIFGAEVGWKIEKGELTGAVKNPVYSGKTLDFWGKCESIAKDGWASVSAGCGKGRPHQTARVGHFCSQAKFHDVLFGEPS